MINSKQPIDLNKELLTKCCGSEKWINSMIREMPFNTKEEIFNNAEKVWYSLNKEDWLEAFSQHPKIGDINSLTEKFYSTKELAGNEQAGVNDASIETLTELAKLNDEYEKKFGYIFIVCASGKSADEMLHIIKERIKNNSETEIKIAMEEQNKITKLRLEKLI
jgi:2-oxo-4-hydroxy-4-carboxy-5-ureidoimidazoline decarboxylase